EQVKTLEHHADFAPDFVDPPQVRSEIDAFDDDLAFLEFLQRVDAADQCRFARTRGAADDDALALGDIEVDVAQDVKVPVPFIESLDADDLICAHGCTLSCGDARSACSRRTANSATCQSRRRN